MTQFPAGLQLGDRLPNFIRPDHGNALFNLYKDCCGEEVTLLALSLTAVEGLATDGSLPAAAEVIPMLRGSATDAAQIKKQLPGVQHVVADNGEVIDFISGDGSFFAVACVLDRNFRVVARLESTAAAGLASLLERATAARAMVRPAPSAQHAPVLVIPDVFEPEFCKEVIRLFDEGGSEPSGVLIQKADGRLVYEADEEVKVRREHRVQDGPMLKQILHRIERRVLPEIHWAFNFPVSRFEGVKVVLYDADSGGFFSAHRDNDGPDTAHRRFAMTLNLNSEEYAGGALRFPEYGPAEFKPPSGAAVIFSCNLAHEALPVTRGQRYAVVSFFHSSAEQQQHVDMEHRV